MANDKFIVKNGLIAQNIDYVSSDRTQEINLELDNTGSLTWSGTSTGNIVTLTDTTTGTVFSIVDSANNEILGIGGDGSISISDSDGNPLLSTSTQTLDVSGSVAASSFVGDLTGNASTASTLETARTITLSGDVTGSASFDGSSNITISTSASSTSGSPTLTLSGDASGSATFTDLNDATLSVSVDGGNADTLDNQNGSYYLNYNNFTNKPSLYNSSDFDSDFSSKTTDNLSEGSNNLYYTNARVDARVGNGTLTVSGVSGLTGSGTFSANQSTNQTIDISHADTSSQGSVNNSGGTVVQDVTLDGFGHITNINSSNLDSRYYSQGSDPQFGNRIGFGNDSNVIEHDDGNSASGAGWSGKDAIYLRGDGNISNLALYAGHLHSAGASEIQGTLTVTDVDYRSPDASHTISQSMLDSDTLSWEGDSGQLFSITDSLTGTIFSVNDISGIPSIEVDDDGTVRLAEFAGNILIGTNTDNGTDKVQVLGTVSATDFNSTSDARAKENIETLTDSLDKVTSLRGVSFTLKESGTESIGVIAQEVEEIVPEVVNTGSDDYKSVSYGNLVGLLIEAVKEQQYQIDELRQQLLDK